MRFDKVIAKIKCCSFLASKCRVYTPSSVLQHAIFRVQLVMYKERENATDRLSVNLKPTTTLTAKLAKVKHYFLRMLCSLFLSFFLFIPLSHRLLLRANKCDRFETLAQCAESSQINCPEFLRHSARPETRTHDLLIASPTLYRNAATPWRHHGYNFVNTWSICKILSLLKRALNFQQNSYMVLAYGRAKNI